MLVYACALSLFGLGYHLIIKKQCSQSNVPWVDGCWPIVGHGIEYQKDPIAFMKRSYKKYGSVFKIKIFRKSVTMICDHNLVKEFFDAKEEEFSFFESLKDHYFDRAFSSDEKSMKFFIECVKKTIPTSARISEFTPIIQDETTIFINELKSFMVDGKLSLDLTGEISHFVTVSTLKCFTRIDVSEELYLNMMDYTNYITKIIGLTYIVPRWAIKLLCERKLVAYRKKVTDYFETIIETYRQDLTKEDSLLIRRAVDYKGGWEYDEKNIPLTNEQIANIIICLIFVSVANTSYAMLTLITDGNDTSSNEDNNLWECVRMNAPIFGINRYALGKKTLGEWQVSGTIAICSAMLMKEPECAGAKYQDADTFNPDRFNTEPKDKYSLMTWGAGTHFCPGKMFAINEIKTVAKMFKETFNVERPKELGKRNYNTPATFAVIPMVVTLTLKD
jgi:sterol 14-demethylase